MPQPSRSTSIPDESWEHRGLYDRVVRSLYAVPAYFESSTVIEGLVATDLQTLNQVLGELQIDEQFVRRYVNDGFSGGEKKRAEILQLGLLQPAVAIMDETDSGLDIDALRIVSEGINAFHSDSNAILLITHYQRILHYVQPDHVHVLIDGAIVESGDASLAERLEADGYEPFQEKVRQEGLVTA